MTRRIRKAVFPVAGLGTRFLPATKTVPKEMLPIIDKPLIQYAVDEAVEAGCDTMIFVTQAEALGLGHAVLCAKPIVGNEPFAVLLPDDLIWNSGPGALSQMADAAEASNASMIAVQDVPRERTASYGIVASEVFNGREGQITAIVEKPKPEVAPSSLAVVGRYILSPKIFNLLENTTPGAGGEIQLTDAIATLLLQHPVHAYRFRGTRFDCGTHLGLIEATIRYALDHEKLSDAAQQLMQNALMEMGVTELQ